MSTFLVLIFIVVAAFLIFKSRGANTATGHNNDDMLFHQQLHQEGIDEHMRAHQHAVHTHHQAHEQFMADSHHNAMDHHQQMHDMNSMDMHNQ